MIEKAIKAATEQTTRLVEQKLEARNKSLNKLQKDAERILANMAALLDKDVTVKLDVTHNEPFTVSRAVPSRTPLSPSRAKPRTPNAVNAEGFARPQMRILESLAMWKALGHETPSREMVAAVAGYSPGSGGFNNLLGGLGTMGAIGKPMPGRVSLLVDGIGVLSREEGREMLIGSLENPQRKLVAALNGAGTITRDELAVATAYSAGSGGFNNLVGSLGTLGIVDKPQPGYVALSQWAQELLAGYEMRAAA